MIRLKTKREIIVHPADGGRSHKGVLVSTRGSYIGLRRASIEFDNAWQGLDGLVLIPKKLIGFIQYVD